MTAGDELLAQAIASFQAGQLDDAERQFKVLLAQEPNHLAGLNLLGIVLTAVRKYDEAERTIRAAIAVKGNSDATHHNHGMVLKALMRPDQALAAFDRALAINPAAAGSWGMRGAVLNELGRHGEAIDSADRALQINGNSAEAWYTRGVACSALKQPEEAATAFDKAIGLKPDFVQAWLGLASILSLAKQSEDALTAYDRALALTADLPEAWLGRALSLAQLKRAPEAVAAYRDAVKHGVDAEQVNYHLAALGAGPPPAAAPAMNMIAVFDQYAETFDQHLVESLNYKIPVEMAAAVKRYAAKDGLDILDLGCGTGLVGEQLSPLKRSMTGVDLSPKMLAKAKVRRIYDKLIQSELIQFLDAQGATYDVAVCADVFIYIGDLAPVFGGVRRALKENGVFCFSVEASEDRDVVVRESFRFAHSAAYIERLARENRFSIEELTPAVIRRDSEATIGGYLVVLRRIG